MAGMQVNVDLRAGKDLAFAALKIVELYVNDSGDNVQVNKQPNGSLKFEFESDQEKPNKMLTAQWVFSFDSAENGKLQYYCSNCNHLGKKSNYCPSCGARMTE